MLSVEDGTEIRRLHRTERLPIMAIARVSDPHPQSRGSVRGVVAGHRGARRGDSGVGPGRRGRDRAVAAPQARTDATTTIWRPRFCRGARSCAKPRDGCSRGPASRTGPTKNSSSPACSGRSRPGKVTAANPGSVPHACPPASPWKSSTSTTPAASSGHHRPPVHPRLRHREGQRGLPRTARYRQDTPGDRARDPRLPGRAPGLVRHRRKGSHACPTPTTAAGWNAEN